MSECEDQISEAKAERPKMRDWLWHPWYAKLWLSLILLSLLAGYLLPHDLLRSHEGVATVAMVLVLNPYLFIGVLGFGYFRAAWSYKFGPITPVGDNDWERRSLRWGDDPTNPGDPSWFWYRHRRDML